MGRWVTGRTDGLRAASDLQVLRSDVLERLLLLTFVGVVVAAVILGQAFWVQAAVILVGGGLSCLWGYAVFRRHPYLAALGFCVGCFATLTVIVVTQPAGGATIFYAGIVCMIAAVSEFRYALASALSAAAVVALVAQHSAVTPSVPLVIGLIGMVLAISWLATSPVQTALAWSWRSHVQAVEQVERLRDQQAVLRRTVKSLNDAYERLEEANRELTRAREAALEARRRKAEFIVNLSHELRTPLNLILGFSRLIAHGQATYGTTLPPAYREDVDAIVRNAQHLAGLVDDILDFGQIEAGRMALRKEHTVVAHVVSEAVAAVAGLYHAKGLGLHVEIPAALPEGYFDRTRVRQILINLLSNAVRFTDEGAVTVSATVDERNVILSVGDRGTGIRPEDQPFIWEEFRQFGPPERCRGGSGMGLAICKLFAELHGGSIWVESTPGEGATFFVSFPRAATIDTVPLPINWRTRLPIDRERPHDTVVIVTDDPANGRLFERYLDGYRVITAPNESRAARFASTDRVAGIVAIGSSEGTLEPLRLSLIRRLPGLPVLTCVMPGHSVHLATPGVIACLPKPVSREDIARALRQLGRSAKRLLVVDDDRETVRLIGRLARSVSRRYRVTDAFGGAEALAILERECFDGVILDLAMPGVDGHHVLAALRTRVDRPIPVILISGQSFGDGFGKISLIAMSRNGGLSVRETMSGLRGLLEVTDCRDIVPDSAQSRQSEPRA